MSNTKPKMINGTGMRVDFEGESLKDVIKTLENAVNKYGENATIQNEYHTYDDSHYSYIRYQRLETEQESVRRVAEEEKSNTLRENYDQAEFLRLSQKYALKVT